MGYFEVNYFTKMAAWHLKRAEQFIKSKEPDLVEYHQKKAKKLIRKARKNW